MFYHPYAARYSPYDHTRRYRAGAYTQLTNGCVLLEHASNNLVLKRMSPKFGYRFLPVFGVL